MLSKPQQLLDRYRYTSAAVTFDLNSKYYLCPDDILHSIRQVRWIIWRWECQSFILSSLCVYICWGGVGGGGAWHHRDRLVRF